MKGCRLPSKDSNKEAQPLSSDIIVHPMWWMESWSANECEALQHILTAVCFAWTHLLCWQCGGTQRHSSHSEKTPLYIISCLPNSPSLVSVVKGLCLQGESMCTLDQKSHRSDGDLEIKASNPLITVPGLCGSRLTVQHGAGRAPPLSQPGPLLQTPEPRTGAN